MEDTINEVLKEHGIHYSLKMEQIQAINAVVQKSKNVFCLLPTGYGKSDCYGWLSPVMDKVKPGIRHVTLVISPLRALMLDQVERWSKQGIRCAAIMRSEEMDEATKDGIRKGEFELVFSSPEAVLRQPWWSVIRQWSDRLTCVVFDEAHCMSKWGSFREEYLKVFRLRSVLSYQPVLCLTATATQSMMEDIIGLLQLDIATFEVIAVLPDRPNIKLEAYEVDSTEPGQHLAWYINALLEHGRNAPKAIIYTRQINDVARIYAWLMFSLGEKAWFGTEETSQNQLVDMYHGGTDVVSQRRVASLFCQKTSTLRCVVATMAFGMGIQVEDVEFVIHWGPAKDVLSYWQEVGRCARDGRQGYARLYVFPRSMNKRFIDDSMIQLWSSIKRGSCIRRMILKHLQMTGMKEYARVNDLCCSACTEE